LTTSSLNPSGLFRLFGPMISTMGARVFDRSMCRYVRLTLGDEIDLGDLSVCRGMLMTDAG
jgi:hypothetical protein